MYVGVILSTVGVKQTEKGVPHVCGGDPRETVIDLASFQCSPCMWG